MENDYSQCGMSGESIDPRVSLFEPDPQYDRKKNLRTSHETDTTELNTGVGDGMWVQRDLSAHQFRWGFVGRLLTGKESILDLGCGSKMPLANTLNCGLGSYLPKLYVGVDYGKFERKSIGKRKLKLWEGNHREGFDATNRASIESLINENGHFDIVTSFEVVEHIYPAESVLDYLDNAFFALKPGGKMFLSTPIVDVNSKNEKARAKNHIHEFTIEELESIVVSCGFTLKDRFGTFANYHSVKKALIKKYGDDSVVPLEIYERLREFYSDDVLACFLAPAFASASRNQFLILEKP